MEWWKDYFSEFYYKAAFSMNSSTKKQIDFVLNQVELNAESRILDMCCGYGRHSMELAKRGYQVTGIDYSRELIEIAKSKCENEGIENVRFEEGDIRRYNESKLFDLTISMFVSLGYFENEDENISAIKVLCNSVRENGYLFLDLYNYNKMYSEYENKMRYPGGIEVTTQRKFDKDNKIAYINKIVKSKTSDDDKRYEMRIRVYTMDEIISICAANNMRLYKSFGNYDGSAFDKESDKMLLLFKKEF